MYYTKSNSSEGINGVFIHNGLGKSATNGMWQTFTRNIEDDLHDVEPDNKLISTNYFMVLGDGLIDDIYMSDTKGSTSTGTSSSDKDTSDTVTTNSLPKCDINNPEVQFIKNLQDWENINRADKRIFCVKPNVYFSSVSQDNILITSSGTASKKRYILLDNSNNIHPAKLSVSQLAKVRFTFKLAKNWEIDRMSYWGNAKEPILKFIKSDNIKINRYFAKNTNYGILLYPGTKNTTIQNSRMERTSPFLLDNAAIGLTNNSRENISIKNTKILNNEIRNYNDPFQSIKTGTSNQKNINYEGTLIEGNHFYVDNKIYTDCHGNPNPKGNCSYSENAIDLKSGSENSNNKMIVRNNKMWGFRRADKTKSGMSDNGVAIIIHYNVKNIEIRNNLVFDSTHSIVSSVAKNGYAMQNANISNNIFYNIKERAFYIGEAKNVVMSSNLFKKTSDKGTYWGIIDSVKNMRYTNNIISSKPQHYKSFYTTGGSYSGNIVYGEEAPSYDGFTQVTTDPTSSYKNLTFVTDRYTNNPRTITIPKVLKP
jgi:hypothetical protein